MLNARRLQVRIQVGVCPSVFEGIFGKSLIYGFSIKSWFSQNRVDKCLDLGYATVRKSLYFFD